MTASQLPIDHQLIEAVRIVSEAGLNDAAEWIKRKAMATVDEALADIEAPASEPIAITQFAVSPALCGEYLYATVPPGITKPMSRCASPRPCAIHPVTKATTDLPVQPLSETEEAELRALEAKITPGPWETYDDGFKITAFGTSFSASIYGDHKEIRANAEGIVALRNAAPRMFATITERRERITFLEKTRDELQAANTREVEARRTLASRLETARNWLGEMARQGCRGHRVSECCDNPERLVPCVHAVAQKYMRLVEEVG